MNNTWGAEAEQTYDPMGVSQGSYGAGFGLTGEQRDDNALVYLRARYYNPTLGVFPSRDPFAGLMGRPMSLNGYSWVEGNPIMNTDPSGKDIDRNDVEEGRFLYSCNCGWIDLAHAKPENPLILLTAVSHALNPGLYSDPNNKGVAFQYTYGTESGRWLSDDPDEDFFNPVHVRLGYLKGRLPWYYISKTSNTPGMRDLIALAIFLDLLSFIEDQELNNFPPEAPLISASGQSAEDLPSYLMGFYMAKRLEESGRTEEAFQMRSSSELWQYMSGIVTEFLGEPCRVLTSQQSLEVYDTETSEDRPKNPTFLPVDRADNQVVNSYCPDTPRDQSRIPSEIFGLVGSSAAAMLIQVGASFSREGRCDNSRLMDNLPFPIYPGKPDGLRLYECSSC
ncbi:MAG: hypothetical protein OHK0046_48280 [Anaerolineae bacterium]